LGHVTRSEAVTEGLRVQVEAHYSPEHSDPGHSQWFFLYTIRLRNEGERTCQLLSRHWIIRSGTGNVEEVRGPGVVGEQPVLEPGDAFEYTSGCPLDTPFGSMEGTYQMVREDGSHFEAEIERFELRQPQALH
jgi:ApaG protein